MSNQSQPPASDLPSVPRHEPESLWVGTVTTTMLALALLLGVVMGGVALGFRFFAPATHATGANDTWEQQHLDPGVQPNQAYDRQQMTEEQKAYLKQYAWLDKERGIARIPIDRSIEIMAERGLQVEWPSGDVDASVGAKSP